MLLYDCYNILWHYAYIIYLHHNSGTVFTRINYNNNINVPSVIAAGTRRDRSVEHGRRARNGRRAARRVEGTARRRGHVRGAETLRQGHGEQVREEVQAVRRVTSAINNNNA